MKDYAVILVENRAGLVSNAIKNHLPFLPKDWRLHQISEPWINSLEAYNKLMTSKSFWENFMYYDRVLIIQHDSALLRKGIEDFLQWDYIGAPWKFQDAGGNGGLSLRNPRAMFDICNKYVYDQSIDGYEDIWFSRFVGQDWRLAPREECFKFSCETIYQEGTLGIHAIDKYLTTEQCQKLRNQYGQN